MSGTARADGPVNAAEWGSMVGTGRARRLAARGTRRLDVPSANEDALSHGIALVVAPLAFGLLGIWIDHQVGTRWVFAAVLAAFGLFGSVASLYYRYEQRISRLDEGKPWTRKAAGS